MTIIETMITARISALTAADWQLYEMRGSKAAASRLNTAAIKALGMKNSLAAELAMSFALVKEADYGADEPEAHRLAKAMIAVRYRAALPGYSLPGCDQSQPVMAALLAIQLLPAPEVQTTRQRTPQPAAHTVVAYDPADCGSYATI